MPAHDSSSALISDDASARVESEAAMPRSVGSTSARSLETVSAVELGEGDDIRAAGVRTAGSGRRGARAHVAMVANIHMSERAIDSAKEQIRGISDAAPLGDARERI